MNIKPFAELWLQAKDKQATIKARRESLIKLIQSRETRLTNLQTTIQADIDKYQLSITKLDAELHLLETTKDIACMDMLATLEGGV